MYALTLPVSFINGHCFHGVHKATEINWNERNWTELNSLLNWNETNCDRWQITLCDPIWQVTLRSSEMGSREELCTPRTLFWCVAGRCGSRTGEWSGRSWTSAPREWHSAMTTSMTSRPITIQDRRRYRRRHRSARNSTRSDDVTGSVDVTSPGTPGTDESTTYCDDVIAVWDWWWETREAMTSSVVTPV